MIFAKLDVCFWRHKKFKRAGTAACGYYAAALAYLREDETRDGVLEDDVIGQILDVGEREAAKLLERLIDVGLFERVEGGYLLLGYAEKNETRDAIEARRSATKSRVDKYRSSRRMLAGNAVTVDHDNPECNALHHGVTSDVTESFVTRPSGAFVPGSDSDSLSGSDRGESERGSPVKPVALPNERVVEPGDAITPELTAIAQMSSVQDVRGAWLKFCGYYAGQLIHVAGKWQSWSVTEAKRERTDRERVFNSAKRWQQATAEPPKPIRVTPEDVEDAERAYEAYTRGNEVVEKVASAAAGGKRQ